MSAVKPSIKSLGAVTPRDFRFIITAFSDFGGIGLGNFLLQATGMEIPAVSQLRKQGFVFMLKRIFFEIQVT